ncbi:hypothetical protein [Chitinilyticum aquatile]|uniref:hypothetical protein n=1 Tax=Chitinilyticum aquatile TaxID=362520 RepID=UPI00041AF549|nr:hypothetical protein [Chitinilyticum aquatile]
MSNDVRNYTLNLFNHYLVRRLIKDAQVQLSKDLVALYETKDSLAFRYACLLYLENLFVFSMLQHEYQGQGVETVGVLGISNARLRWSESSGNPTLAFTVEKPGQLLVRQLSLGVSGRYKTPMIELGFFDKYYHYQLPTSASVWQVAETFIGQHESLSQLAELLVEHLKTLLSQSSRQPMIAFQDIPAEISALYVKGFASPQIVGSYARKYWLSVTDLDRDAAGCLLDVLDKTAKNEPQATFSPQEFMRRTNRTNLSLEERTKLEHIEELEPFLADAMLLFTLLTHKKSQSLEAVMKRWSDFDRDETTLPLRAQRLRDNAGLLVVLGGSARLRLEALLGLADASTLLEQIRILVDYHARVMHGRGQQPWLNLIDGDVRVHARPMACPAEAEWPQGAWYHSYYLPQFQSLVQGYQGSMA